MRKIEDQFLRHREIAFCELHPDPRQAESAALALADMQGVIHVQLESPLFLSISYNVLQITLEQIEARLCKMGFHLDNRLVYRLKRALAYYTEETVRVNNGCAKGESNCTQKIFADRYARGDHGCRDHRPEHWRRYL
jgi:hypothetical protein